jgi:hypothetical protein
VYGVIVRRGEAPGQIEITLQGKLRALLSQPVAKPRVGGSMVAKVRYQRTAHQNEQGIGRGFSVEAVDRYQATPEPIFEIRMVA